MALITLSDKGIETIKANAELQKKEMEYVQQWKEENILESFFISVSKKDAVLIFRTIDESKTKELIAALPYFPYMAKIEYHLLNKQF
jgi:muconolactone delta-isomerase